MQHQSEPCGSLPKTHLSVHLAYCQHHQAWTLTTNGYMEDGDLILDAAPYTAMHFGPFDGLQDVERVAVEALRELLTRVTA